MYYVTYCTLITAANAVLTNFIFSSFCAVVNKALKLNGMYSSFMLFSASFLRIFMVTSILDQGFRM